MSKIDSRMARVEALLDEWRATADSLALTEVSSFDHIVNLSARGTLFDCIDDLRAALADPEENP